MRCFWDARQLAHAPALELHNGGFVPFAEAPARAEAILAALEPVEASASTPAARWSAMWWILSGPTIPLDLGLPAAVAPAAAAAGAPAATAPPG